MLPSFIQPTRIQNLNDRETAKGAYVLYWMQQSQRAEYNHALEYSLYTANRLKQPLIVLFCLTDNYPEANLRHYAFMVEGLLETRKKLEDRGIRMIARIGRPDRIVATAGRAASVIVCDRGYLKHQKKWRDQIADAVRCRVVRVESDTVIPVEVVSKKAEYAARTIRPRVHRHLPAYLTRFRHTRPAIPSLNLEIRGIPLDRTESVLGQLKIDRSVPPVPRFFKGGTTVAKYRFRQFVRNRLSRYDKNGNQPQTDDISHMSPYLHFGQISPLYLALRIKASGEHLKPAQDALLEQLFIRRELAINFVTYTPRYDTYDCAPGWAKQTLDTHRKDHRPYLYGPEELDRANTHDPYWNAAMQEMKFTGFMHNYMRMYWGKKILEWSKTPQTAYKTILALNNRYFLDGRDPNSYAGVAWTFGVHDRAWPERPIFGKIRYMAASGLERKCAIGAYVEKVAHRVKKANHI